MVGVDQPAEPMPALLLCHGHPLAVYPDVRIARAAGTSHLRSDTVKTVTWRPGAPRTWIAHHRHTDLDHQVVLAFTAPTHGVTQPRQLPDNLLATLRGPARRQLARLQYSYPWHYTHEFTRIAEGLGSILACTSLDDTAAAYRARLVPSGTSDGWQPSTRTPVATCPDRPDTHRHIRYDAAITW